MSYDSEVLADHPISYVRCDDAVGSATAADAGSAGLVWTYSPDAVLGRPPIVHGTSASASNAASGNLHPIATSAGAPGGFAGFSWELWFDTGGVDQFGFLLMAQIHSTDNSYDGVGIAIVNADVTGPGQNLYFNTASLPAVNIPLPPGPHHLVITYDGATYNSYLDGAALAPGAQAHPPPFDVVEGGALGGYDGGALEPTSDLRLSHLAMYGAALSADRVQAHYAAGAAPPEVAHAHGRTQVFVVHPVHGTATAGGRSRVAVLPVLVPQRTSSQRAVQGLVLTMPVPVVVDGRPYLPAHHASFGPTFTAVEGAKHIHAIKDPNPVWNPVTGGWVANPPPAPPRRTVPWDARWSVNDLPSPGGGYYWLGSPSSADGTGGIQQNARLWKPCPSTPHAPAWHSAFPYKPSVTAHDHYLQGGGVVHHPKGVNFNSHFIEHMWATFPKTFPQPYTWVIAGIVGSWPSPNYVHTILDTGVDPRTRGQHLDAYDVDRPRHFSEGTSTRTYMRLSHHEIQIAAHTGQSGGPVARARVNTHLRPCMFVGIFNGAGSYAGTYAPGEKRLTRGRLSGASPRTYVIGRQHNYLDQRRASHLVLFEIRFFTRALTRAELDEQYSSLSSSHQFERYRNL